ncbi:hypothetical protein [Desulfocicer niacini]
MNSEVALFCHTMRANAHFHINIKFACKEEKFWIKVFSEDHIAA